MASEPFPIFPAVLNAIHQQGARVRMLINDYGQPTCPGMISFLDYWALNGVNISYYTSTTFLHAKYMRVQTAAGYFRTSISSINWSKVSPHQHLTLCAQCLVARPRAMLTPMLSSRH